MLKKFLIAILWCKASVAAVVFVHIGPILPDHTLVALKQARLFNEQEELVLIADEATAKPYLSQLADLRVCLVPISSLKPSPERELFLKRTILTELWKVSTERFFYLYEWIEATGARDVFHLENDNLLYVDLNELLPVFRRNYPGLGVTFDNDGRGIAGFMYISSSAAMKAFIEFILAAPPGTNDMGLLVLYKRASGNIANLPIIMPEYTALHPLRSLWGHTPSNPASFSLHFDEFLSLFDAAALGQYIGGGGWAGPGFINPEAVINPSKLTFSWFPDVKGRRIPYLRLDMQWVRINNLHIHSKQLQKYAS